MHTAGDFDEESRLRALQLQYETALETELTTNDTITATTINNAQDN